MKNKIIFIVLFALLIPNLTLASWWNPFTWFEEDTKIETSIEISTSSPVVILEIKNESTWWNPLSWGKKETSIMQEIATTTEEIIKEVIPEPENIDVKTEPKYIDEKTQLEIETAKAEAEKYKLQAEQARLEIEKLKQENTTQTQTQTQTEAKKEISKNTTVTLPNGSIVEMDEYGNIVKTIKEADEKEIKSPFQSIPEISLKITKPQQPTAKVIYANEQLVEFTKIQFEALNGDVTIDSIVIERGGLADDGIFLGVTLIDENNNQIGDIKKLNSIHEVTIDKQIIIPAGTTKIFTIVANIQKDIEKQAGQTSFFTLKKVTTSVPIINFTSIIGTGHTAGAPQLAKVIVSPGEVDYRCNQPYKQPGINDYIFSAIEVTTDKKVFLNSIRWNMPENGSIYSLENLKTYVGEVAYDTTVSIDGKFTTSNFEGLIISDGETKKIFIKGDLPEDEKPTIAFDIYKNTDLNITNENGKIIIPEPERMVLYKNAGEFMQYAPWYDGYVVVIKEEIIE